MGAVLLVIKQVTPVSAIEETLITCDAPLPPTLRCTARGSKGFLGAGAATGGAGGGTGGGGCRGGANSGGGEVRRSWRGLGWGGLHSRA